MFEKVGGNGVQGLGVGAGPEWRGRVVELLEVGRKVCGEETLDGGDSAIVEKEGLGLGIG